MQKEKESLGVQLIPDYLSTMITIPPEQREGGVWTLEQRQSLIDSLYNDYDIPKIYFKRSPENPEKWELSDGQQRLTCIQSFLKDEFPLATETTTLPEEIRGLKYSQLLPQHKQKIISRTLDAVILSFNDEWEEEDLFIRLNKGTPLNSAEKRNAILGKFRDLAIEISKNDLISKKGNFSHKRYADHAIAAQLIALTLADGPTDLKGGPLNGLYKKYKDTFQKEAALKARINRNLNYLNDVFSADGKNLLLKKSMLISWYGIVDYLHTNYVFPDAITPAVLNQAVFAFEAKRDTNAKLSGDDDGFDKNLFEFYEKTVNSPDGLDAVRFRHETLMNFLATQFPDLTLKDPDRLFTEEQKRAIYIRASGKCAHVEGFDCPNADGALPSEITEYDHIIPHAHGGKTSVANGQLLCRPCHQQKTSTQRRRRDDE